MKYTEELKTLKNLTVEQLGKELAEAQKKALTDSLRVQAGKLDNYSLVSKNKKKIARISTIINEKLGNE